MRVALNSFFSFLVECIPKSLMKRLLRTVYVKPNLAGRVGYHVFPMVFYNPFPDPSEVDAEKLKLKRPLPGIDLNVPGSLELLKKLSRFSGEVAEFTASRTGVLKFWDRTYPPADYGTLYAMLREIKPRRFIEVGCGYSSRASTAALKRNASEGHPCQCTFIEPYPPPYFTELQLPGEFIKQKVQQIPLARFQELEDGDVLFIDTSHVIKVQNDVEYELLQILPSLKPGVFVHIHDIFTPYDYPAEWMIGDGTNLGGNNEQYALECLLSGGKTWEVILPVYLLWRDHPEVFKALVDSEHRAGAFWIRKSKAG